MKSGVLQRLDTAFSRDQREKICVQDRIREQARQLWDWLEQGACFYVCGNSKRMAPDVEAAMLGPSRNTAARAQTMRPGTWRR
jgi:sulfite reductase (NADPH) flavoprotein alpha-component